MKKAEDVPICVAGGITVVNPSFCMDQATHLVCTSLFGAIRVRPTNDESKKALEQVEDTKVMVTVCGYQKKTENCTHLDAYYVGLSEEFSALLTGSAGPRVGNG